MRDLILKESARAIRRARLIGGWPSFILSVRRVFKLACKLVEQRNQCGLTLKMYKYHTRTIVKTARAFVPRIDPSAICQVCQAGTMKRRVIASKMNRNLRSTSISFVFSPLIRHVRRATRISII